MNHRYARDDDWGDHEYQLNKENPREYPVLETPVAVLLRRPGEARVADAIVFSEPEARRRHLLPCGPVLRMEGETSLLAILRSAADCLGDDLTGVEIEVSQTGKAAAAYVVSKTPEMGGTCCYELDYKSGFRVVN